jgi:hypothetical protein
MTTVADDLSDVHVADPAAYRDWDAFVAQHADGTVYHLSSWKTALEAGFQHIRGHLIIRRDPVTGRICAGLPLYLVRSPLTGSRLVSVPFASFGGALTSNPDDAPALLKLAFEVFSQEKPSFTEVRLRRSDSALEALEFGHSRRFVHHYLSLEGGLTDVHRRLHAKSVRNSIKKALKSRLVLKDDCRREDVPVYYKIYSAARKKLGLPAMPQKFFVALWDEFWPKRCLTLLLCLLDSRPVGAALLLTFKDMMIIEYGHTLPGYRAHYVDPFLDWQAVRLASARGCKYLSFGRTSPSNAGLMMYKRHWGTVEEPLHCYFYPSGSGAVDDRPGTSWQSRVVRPLCRLCPQRMYVQFSSAIYRHLG